MIELSDNPLVSVVVAAYNQGAWLSYAIESALAQTYPHVEVVVVNDGSTDPATRQTADKFEGRIVYLEQANAGTAAARNTGFAAAKGELIALLDHDDVWLPQKLEVQVKAYQAHPHVGLVHSGFYNIDSDGRRTGVAQGLLEGIWKPLPALLLDNWVLASTALFPKRLVEEIGGFDPGLSGADDWAWYLRAAAHGYPFYNVAAPLAEYRVHTTNISRDLDTMVKIGLGTLDGFYAMPDLPPVALDYHDRAYFNRHAWATAIYFGAGRLDAARRHLHIAASLYPEGIATGRFLRSLVSSVPQGPSTGSARNAVSFVWREVGRDKLPPDLRRKLKSRSRLVLALHAGAANPFALAGNIAAAVLADPALALDREVWATARRMMRRAIPSGSESKARAARDGEPVTIEGKSQ